MKKSVLLFVFFMALSCAKEENIEPLIVQEEPEEEIIDQVDNEENNAPEKAILIAPLNGETVDQFLDVVLKWEGRDSDEDDLSYGVFLGTDPTNLEQVAENIKVDSLLIDRLDTGVEYFWEIVSKDVDETENTSELSGFTIYEKVYEGFVRFSEQSDVETFINEGYTKINGDLEIKELVDITNLTNLNRITGLLAIQYTSLTNLDGLQNLIEVGNRLYIEGNSLLTSVSELSSVRGINEQVSILSNERLESLLGLEGVSSLQGNLEIIGNNRLQNLQGLENIVSLGGELIIDDNANLLTIASLSQLKSADAISVEDNQSLVSLDGLQNVNEIAYQLSIESNPNLQEVNVFDNLIQIGEELSIFQNTNLKELSGFNQLKSVPRIAIIANNNLDTVSGFNQLTGENSEVIFESVSAVQTFKGFSGIDRMLYLRLNGMPNLIDFEALANLKSVTNLSIGNTNFKSLEFFKQLEGIDNLTVDQNSDLIEISFENLASLKNLRLAENSKLDILRFPKLEQINENLKLTSNPELKTLDGFNSLSQVGGELSFQGNGLIDYCALQNVAREHLENQKEAIIVNNGFNPTIKMIAAGQCKQ